jgi:site-specific recombinase XerD
LTVVSLDVIMGLMTDLKSLPTAKDSFIAQLKKDNCSSSTILAYRADLTQLIEFLNKKQITQTTSVSSEHIENFKEYLSTKKYTPKSISRKLNSIKSFFRFLAANKVISEDPAAPVAHPKFEIAPPRILSKMEYRALRDAARDDPRMAAIIETLLQTGLRIGELARLELENITDKEIQIKAYESQPARTVPLNQAIKRALNRYLDLRPKTKTKAIFITKTNRPIHVRNIRSSVQRFFRLAGIQKATVNDLRHTFICHQLSTGVSPVLVQKIAGHKRLSTTEKYLDLIKEKIATSEKLEEL